MSRGPALVVRHVDRFVVVAREQEIENLYIVAARCHVNGSHAVSFGLSRLGAVLYQQVHKVQVLAMRGPQQRRPLLLISIFRNHVLEIAALFAETANEVNALMYTRQLEQSELTLDLNGLIVLRRT